MQVCGPSKQVITLEKWFQFLRNGDVQQIQKYSADFATQINQQNGLTGLMTAFVYQKWEAFNLLIPLEISLRSAEKFLIPSPFVLNGKYLLPMGSTILHFIVASGNDDYFFECLRYIEQNSLNYLVELTNKNEETLLLLSAKFGYIPPFLDGICVENAIQIKDVENVSAIKYAIFYGRLKIMLQFERICEGDIMNMERTQYLNLDLVRREIKEMCFEALDDDNFVSELEVFGEFEKYRFREEDREACVEVAREICGYV